MNLPDFEFDIAKFDANFLLNLMDHGINITEFNYSSEVAYHPEDFRPLIRGRLDKKGVGTEAYYFAFLLDSVSDMFDSVEEMAANRAALKVRDHLQPWRTEGFYYIEEHLDKGAKSA